MCVVFWCVLKLSRTSNQDVSLINNDCSRNAKALLSVCTRTLWLGHLAKQTMEEDLRKELESYGEVDSIHVSTGSECVWSFITGSLFAVSSSNVCMYVYIYIYMYIYMYIYTATYIYNLFLQLISIYHKDYLHFPCNWCQQAFI